jgi:DNA repair exonuclease SbcCD ATPase subunit
MTTATEIKRQMEALAKQLAEVEANEKMTIENSKKEEFLVEEIEDNIKKVKTHYEEQIKMRERQIELHQQQIDYLLERQAEERKRIEEINEKIEEVDGFEPEVVETETELPDGTTIVDDEQDWSAVIDALNENHKLVIEEVLKEKMRLWKLAENSKKVATAPKKVAKKTLPVATEVVVAENVAVVSEKKSKVGQDTKAIFEKRSNDWAKIPDGAVFIAKYKEYEWAWTYNQGTLRNDNGATLCQSFNEASKYMLKPLGVKNLPNAWELFKINVDGKMITASKYVETL